MCRTRHYMYRCVDRNGYVIYKVEVFFFVYLLTVLTHSGKVYVHDSVVRLRSITFLYGVKTLDTLLLCDKTWLVCITKYTTPHLS